MGGISRQWVNAVVNGRTRELTLGYRRERRDTLKNESMLFAVPCIFEGGKAQKHVVRLTGLSMVDFDHLEELKDGRIEELKSSIASDCGYETGRMPCQHPSCERWKQLRVLAAADFMYIMCIGKS